MTDAEQPRRAIEAVWRRSLPTLRERVAVLERMATALVTGDLDETLRGEACLEAHRLAGSLGTFGRHAGSEAARALETRLLESRPFADDEVRHTSDLVLRLVQIVEQAEPEEETPSAAAPTAQPTPGTDRSTPEAEGTVWCVGQDAEFVARFENAATGRGWSVHAYDAAKTARRALERPPHQLVATWRDPEAPRLIEEARRIRPSMPIVVLGDDEDLDARVAAARSGATRYLSEGLEPDELVRILASLAESARSAEGHVLLVDDDVTVLDAVAPALQRHGFEVAFVDEPERFWAALQSVRPQLVLLDLDMPGHDGLALCRAVRTDPRWDATQVVLFTGKQVPRLRERASQAGADDVVLKPIDPERLAARLAARSRRTEGARSAATTDPETGATAHAVGAPAAESTIALAAREGRPLSLALIRAHRPLEDPAREDDRRRLLASALRHHLRHHDNLYVQDDAFVVVAYGLDAEVLAERVQNALHEAARRPLGRHLQAAVVDMDPEKEDLAALLHAATSILDRASTTDGVHLQPGAAAAVERPDVVVVDDDETLAALLRHTLETAGYGCAWIPDGQQALDLLGGAEPRIRPRLVLLDVNLPGLDGLSLLRRLRDDGVLERTKVIMLTARAAESEVVKALGLGADDHVAKPFSIPILLQRVRKSIGR